MEHVYKVKSRNGFVVVFDNGAYVKPRKCYKADFANLSIALNILGISSTNIKKHRDLGGKAIRDLLKAYGSKDYTAYDFLLVIMTGYGDQGVIYGVDGVSVHLEESLMYFKGDINSSLVGKPKLFIFQVDEPTLYGLGGEEADVGDQRRYLPAEADFLQVWSLIPGDVSWRTNPSKGSCFIDHFTSCLKEYSSQLEITKLLTRTLARVAVEMETYAQTHFDRSGQKLPLVISLLTKDLYLRK